MGAAIAPISPASGVALNEAPITFSWTSIEGAVSYRVSASVNSFRTFDIGTTALTELDWDVPLPEAGDTYFVRWKVYAMGILGEEPSTTISWFEVPATFTIEGPTLP